MFNFFKKLLGIGSDVSQETVAEILTPPVTEAKPERAKDAKGKFVGDNPATPAVNEAWKSGKAPVKKVKANSIPIKEGQQRVNVKKSKPNSPKPKAPPAPKAKK